MAADSADVWANQAQFQLDEQGKPRIVAGIPPSHVLPSGQRWTNPHYDWQAMRETQYQWWIQRLQHQEQLFDRLRINHFCAFEAAWAIPFDGRNRFYSVDC